MCTKIDCPSPQDWTAIDGAITGAITRLNYSRVTEDWEGAIRDFVLVFVGLQTGSGMLICYAALPLVLDILRAQAGSVVVVVCPAIHNGGSIKYRARDLQVAFVGKTQKNEAVREGVAKGNYQLVYMSPEAMVMKRNVVLMCIRTALCVLPWMKPTVWRSGKFAIAFSRKATCNIRPETVQVAITTITMCTSLIAITS